MEGEIRKYFAIGASIVILNILTFHEIFVQNNPSIYEEGEFVECISAFCYLFASVLTFFRGFDRSGLERKLTWLFSLTSLLFFIRELDLEDLNIPPLLINLGTGTGRDVFFGVLFVGLIIWIVGSPSHRKGLRLGIFFQSKVVQMSALGGLLLVLGSIFEHRQLSMVEEILEMNGSLLILFAAILNEKLPMSSLTQSR